MSKEELIEFLKENLKVQINMNRRYGYDSSGVAVEVELVLDGEVISTSKDHVYLD